MLASTTEPSLFGGDLPRNDVFPLPFFNIVLPGDTEPSEISFSHMLTVVHLQVQPDYAPYKVVAALFQQMEKHSPFTVAHSIRVAEVARLLARFMLGVPKQISQVYLAALLHDVGKLAIPVHILEKKSTLTSDERIQIQTHPIFTEIILSSFPVFEAIRSAAVLHHERLDGTGYPYGVTGKKLSLSARIIAVADVFVAMTEDRSYRIGLSNVDALGMLATLADRGQLDENVVSEVSQRLSPISAVIHAPA